MSLVKELEGKLKRIECMESDMATLQASFDNFKVEAEAKVLAITEAKDLEINALKAELEATKSEKAKVDEVIVAKEGELKAATDEIEAVKNVLKDPAILEAQGGVKIEGLSSYVEENNLEAKEETICDKWMKLQGVEKAKFFAAHKKEIMDAMGSK